MEMIDRYLDEVCSYVTSVPYKRAVRRELQNHMEDSMEYAEKNGSDSGDAAKQAISEMGNAREVGSRLNEHFTVRPDIRLVIYVLGIFCLYTAAGLTINYSFPETMITLSAYGACTYLFYTLKKFDLEGNYRLIKYFYLGTLLLLLAVNIFADMALKRRECMSIGGTILFFCMTFFVYRLHRNDTLGLFIALCLFLLPIPLFMFSSAYAALFLYVATGICTFISFIARGWSLKNFSKIIFFSLMAVTLGMIAILCRTNIFAKRNLWDRFFLRDGLDHSSYLTENFRTFPLAACVSRFGYWTIAVYIVLLVLVLTELIRMRRKVHHFWGRNVLNCIIFIFFIKGTFSVLLNLGAPFIRSYMLPFAGFGVDQISNLLLIVTAEYVYCFGNAVFGDCSFFEENKINIRNV